jgi:hypothetical protein
MCEVLLYISLASPSPPPLLSSSPLLFSLSLFSWKSFHTTQPAIDESLRGSSEGFYIPSSTFVYLILHSSPITSIPCHSVPLIDPITHPSPYSSPHSSSSPRSYLGAPPCPSTVNRPPPFPIVRIVNLPHSVRTVLYCTVLYCTSITAPLPQ